ncbi:MAG: hypothetical protein KC431_28860 [Myxococcales bacterium]|nr:hypothetical protein [Myxococcales bacterium]
MGVPSRANSWWQRAIEFGIDVTLLEANLALTPAQRLRELVMMNHLHEQIRTRTLTPAQCEVIDARELEQKFGSDVDEMSFHASARASAD